MAIVKYLCISLLTIATILVLAIVFVPQIELLPELAGQWSWFSKMGILFCFITICTSCFHIHGKSYFPDIVIWVLIVAGGVESVWGLGQLYGLNASNHALYSMTGTFFNPGPYSGYLAMIFSLCLYEYLRLRIKVSKSIFELLQYYLALATMMLIFCVLPAGISRSAWIAVFISIIYVCGVHFSWLTKLRIVYQQKKGKVIAVASVCFVALVLGSIIVFQLKKDSAYGRLFMWKISCLAIVEKPFSGYGANNFPMAYGMAQETYFSKGKYSKQEELVAGSPEYAFNEYLQVAIEWGIPVLIAISIIIILCIREGVKQKNIGICGAIISLLVFGLASYPMQLPTFIITLAFLLAVCLIGQSKIGLLIFALIIGSAGAYWLKRDVSRECKEWTGCHILYRAGAYREATKRYEKLYPKLNNRAIFMYEYGHTLYKLKQYDVSLEILKETTRLSCDPMILNIMGLNYQNKGEYDKAEKLFIRSIHLLPGRLYPYYLLAKLYAVPSFYDEEKMINMANVVLNKEPKVPSKAINTMRKEMRGLLDGFIPLNSFNSKDTVN
ncbi:MAG: O-antigen ligase family protein [Bacteroides thetaiotaomicron]|uniref:O-antigen ligase family protein n=1 Tax=Bacteroides thetaiotaomicron TaxID=818 RepID=A0A943DRY0_BACT4|nr:O-antigen ligase family protein [Bacteroides thetaiotaomicron]